MRVPCLSPVLGNYAPTLGAAEPVEVRQLGLSGARLWRLRSPAGEFCLRRWPDGQLELGRLAFVHFLLRHVAKRQGPPVPLPVRTVAGETFVFHDGTYWQLEPWLPGRADEAPPTTTRVVAAAQTLAQFHRAAVDYPVAEDRRGASGALVQRRQLWIEARDGGIEAIRRALVDASRTDLAAQRAAEPAAWYLHDFESRQTRLGPPLVEAADRSFPLQPVLRDVTRDHVLFVGDEVTGLVDFGAVAVDHPAVDVARWSGSFPLDAARRGAALAAYRSAAQSTDDASEFAALVDLFDRSGTWLAVYRWLRWIYVDRREFDAPERVVDRIAALVARLRNAAVDGE